MRPWRNRPSRPRRAAARAAAPCSRPWASASSRSTAPSKASPVHPPRRNFAPWASWCAKAAAPAPDESRLPRRRQPTVTARLLLCACALAMLWPAAATAGRLVTDSAGRQVEVPDRIERVIAAGPPASVLMTLLAPEKMIGWNRKPPPEELPYLPPVVRNLPEIGRLTGRGNTANLEVVMAAKPDIIVDFGSVSDTYILLADRVLDLTGIQSLLFDGL